MYSKDDIAILYLDSLKLTRKAFSMVLEQLDMPSDIFGKLKNKEDIKKLLPPRALERISEFGEQKIEELVLADLNKFNIYAITILNPLYPTNLKNIVDPPYVLYTKGDVGVLKGKKIGIVGTRMPTNYGRDIANKFTAELVSAGLITVSGLSYGIDTCAAVTTLQNNGKTIAVLAGGLDSIYPAQNWDLSNKIADSGLLISEYRPYIKPRQYSFIARNRIISGLSDGLLVVEAGIKSGATSTAVFCIEQGRELFVIPGNINSTQSAGTNDLINEMPECFTINTKQILQKLGIKEKSKETNKTIQLDMFSQSIVDVLKQEELHFDDICLKLNSNVSETASALTMLEIIGVVRKLSGNYYKLI